jgi:hypothetical protein
VRRDCEPHRGGLLLGLGLSSFLLGLAAATLVVPGLVALPLGLVTWRLVGRDLEAMRAGRMDPAGRSWTRVARWDGLGGAVVAVCGWALFLAAHLARKP